jgi:hypothetical protein
VDIRLQAFKPLVSNPRNMEPKKIEFEDFSVLEFEVILKALGTYQILLFDRMSAPSPSNRTKKDNSDPNESRIVTDVIKKVHRAMEAHKKIEPTKYPES